MIILYFNKLYLTFKSLTYYVYENINITNNNTILSWFLNYSIFYLLNVKISMFDNGNK